VRPAIVLTSPNSINAAAHQISLVAHGFVGHDRDGVGSDLHASVCQSS
jgi:hypothetical protein